MWQVGTIRIGRIGGIALDVHITFALVILWGAWQGWDQYGGLLGASYGILVIALLFACILLHELGHGVQARRFGLVVRRITLLPIGGLAQLETPPAYPFHELLIALAGPLVNFGLAVILGVISYLVEPFTLATWIDRSSFLFPPPLSIAGLLLYLVGANLGLFAFNMIPAFPMDGGRVLRATLALVLDYEWATRLAAWLGRLMALGIAARGLMGFPPTGNPPDPPLLIVGLIMSLMVFFGAQQEEIYVRRQRALVRVEVGDVNDRAADTLAPWDSLSAQLAGRLFPDRVFPVVVQGKVVGLLTYQDIRRLKGSLSSLTVAHAMRTHFRELKPGDTLWVALQEMHAFQLAALPIAENGIYQGMVSLDVINHAWRFAARRRRPGRATLVSGDSVSQ